MKVLVVRFSSIGDIVLTTPVMRMLKMQKAAEVHYLTKKKYASLVENNPYISKVWTLEDSLLAVISELRKEKFNYIIDLHNNLRTAILKLSLWRIKSYTYHKASLQRWLLIKLKINIMPKGHLVDRYLQTVVPLGIQKENLGLDYFIPERDEVPRDWLPEGFQYDYAVYAIGGQHFTKKLPIPKMIELCDRINNPVILLGGKEDFETGEAIAKFFNESERDSHSDGLKRMNKHTKIFNACGKFNLNQSASVTKKAKWVFSHDTGMMHISAALKKDVFSLWGCTVPAFGFYPYKTHFTVIENKSLACRPCAKTGHNKCPKGHFKCMNDLKFDFYLKPSTDIG